jgi:hypothetical protein
MAIPDPTEQPTIGVEELADLYGCSTWQVYQHQNEFPVAPIRVGRLLRWPTLPVLQSLGLAQDDPTSNGPDLKVVNR